MHYSQEKKYQLQVIHYLKNITQIDLPDGKKSGLVEVIKILKNVDDIQTCRFSEKDVVRHKLVQDIIKAYDKYEEAKKKK